VGTALSALVVLAAWLVWLPSPWPGVTIILAMIAIVAALHGWGRLVARCADQEDAPVALVVVWGVAAVVALGGVMLTLQIFDPRMFVIVGTVMHTIDVAFRYRDVGDELEVRLDRSLLRYWIVPTGLVLLFVLVNSLGAAGQVSARPFDDVTNVIAQVHRLASTGALDDPFGLPRGGGFITLASLPTVFGDAQLARLVDAGLGLGLFLWLACALLRPRNAESTIWCTLVIVVGVGLRPFGNDLVPFWISATLLLGLLTTLSRLPATGRRSMIPLGLVAAAACCVRYELAIAALVAIAVAWWRAGAGSRRLVLVTCFAVPVLVYFLASVFASMSIELTTTLPRRPMLWSLLMWSAGAAGLVAIVASDKMPSLRRSALVLGTAACVLAAEAQAAPGRRAWSSRTWELMFDAQYALHRAQPPNSYDVLLARVPAGAPVAVWVMRPEQLELEHHRVFDLRTPRAARANLDDLLYGCGARWLLVESDEPAIAKVVARGRLVKTFGGVQLVELR